MIHSVIVKKNDEIVAEVTATDQYIAADGPTELEVTVDQHYGLRIQRSPEGPWTVISFREGGTWSAPVDTREVVRAAPKPH